MLFIHYSHTLYCPFICLCNSLLLGFEINVVVGVLEHLPSSAISCKYQLHRTFPAFITAMASKTWTSNYNYLYMCIFVERKMGHITSQHATLPFFKSLFQSSIFGHVSSICLQSSNSLSTFMFKFFFTIWISLYFSSKIPVSIAFSFFLSFVAGNVKYSSTLSKVAVQIIFAIQQGNPKEESL